MWFQDPQAWPPHLLPPHVHNKASTKPLNAGPEQQVLQEVLLEGSGEGVVPMLCDPQARKGVIKAQPHQERTRGSNIWGAGLARTWEGASANSTSGDSPWGLSGLHE